MTNIWKRSLSMFLAIVMVVGMIPFNALAVDEEVIEEEVLEVFEDVQEEEVFEEIIEEEVTEEEIFEEEIFEETEEETPAEEEVVDLHASKELADSDGSATEENPTAAEPVIWVNKGDLENEMKDIVFDGVNKAVLEAAGLVAEGSEDADYEVYAVYYDGMDVTSTAFLKAQETDGTLADEVRENGYATFLVKVVATEEVFNVEITFKDSRIKVTPSWGVKTIESFGKPAEDVKATIAGRISVSGVDPQDPEAVVEITAEEYTLSYSSIMWPNTVYPRQSTVTVTIVLKDAIKYDTDVALEAVYTLKDTRQVKYVTYMLDESTQYGETQAYLEDAQMPTMDDPTKDYYDFVQWTDKVEGNTTTRTAEWKVQAEHDVNQNGVADEEETYTVYFMKGYGTMPLQKTLSDKPYGYDFSSEVPTMTRNGWKFLGWDPELPQDGKIVAPEYSEEWEEAEDDIDYATSWIYTAVWTKAENSVVTFKSPDGKTISDKKLVSDEGYVTAPEADTWNGYYVTGWKLPNGTVAESGAQIEAAADMTLTPVWFYDRNGNGAEDNTLADPLKVYQWIVNGDVVASGDQLTGEPAVVAPADPELDQKVFVGWAKTESEADANGKITYTYTAEFKDDVNGNNRPDEAEQVTVTFTTDKGTVYVDGAKVEGEQAFPYRSDKDVTIKAVPDVVNGISKTYVSKILVNGVEQTLTYVAGYAATAVLKAEQIAVAAEEENGAVSVEVVFENVDTSVAANPTMVLSKDAKDLYKALTGKTAADGAEVVAEYKSRSMGKTVQPNVSDLLNIVQAKAANLYDFFYDEYYKDMVGDDGLYDYTYQADEWTEIQNAPAAEEILTAQQAVDAFMTKLWGMTVDEIKDNIDTLKSDLNDSIEAAEVNPFGKGVQTVRVSYTDEKLHWESGAVKLTVEDERAVTVMTVSPKTFAYGEAYTLADLLSGVTVKANGVVVPNAQVSIKGDTNYLGLGVGTYEITLVYAQTEEHQYCEATYTLEITKAEGEIEVPARVVAGMNEDYKAEAAPKANTEFIHMIAGIDINSVDMNIGKESIEVNNLYLKAWIQLPQRIIDMVELAREEGLIDIDLKLGQVQEKDLDEIESMVQEMLGDQAGAILDALKQVRELIQTAEEKAENLVPNPVVKAVFYGPGADIYPKEIGVYVNLGLIYDVDGNYTTASGKGLLLIHPGSALPSNNPDFQLSRPNGSPENVFTFEAGEQVALEVKGHECPIEYYGFTMSGELYKSDKAPSNSGLYVAVAVYSDDQDNLYSDVALVIVDVKPSDVQMANRVVTAKKGQKWMPNITNISSDTARTVISGEVDAAKGTATINVDFPAGVQKVLNAINARLPFNTKLEVPEDITLGELMRELEKIPGFVERKAEEWIPAGTMEILGEIGVDPAYIEKALQRAVDQVDGVMAQLEAFAEAHGLDKYSENVKVTFENHSGYEKAGVYYYAVVVTDPNYAPSADVAYLIVETADFKLENTEVAYDGQPKNINVKNETNRGYLTMVHEGSNLNIILDAENEKAVLAELNALLSEYLGKTIDDGDKVTIEELLAKGSVENVEKLMEKIAEIVIKRLETPAVKVIRQKLQENKYTGKVLEIMKPLVARADAYVQAQIENLTEYLLGIVNDEVDELSNIHNIKSISINGQLPVNPGKYQFHALSYAVAYEQATLTIEDDLFEIYGANVVVESSLDMYFYIEKADLEGEDYYAVVQKTYADDQDDQVAEIAFADWEVYNSKLYRVKCDGIYAFEMTDKIYVTVYNNDGTQASKVWEDSIYDYAQRMMKPEGGKLTTALVDMLNYGAAAQDYFDYNTNVKADADTADFQQFATKTAEYADSRVKGTNYYGTTVTAGDELGLTFYFLNVNADMTATITYTDAYGDEIVRTVYGENFVVRGDLVGVNVPGLAMYDGRQLISCEIYNENGELVASASDSVESYVARMSNTNIVFEMLIKFVDGAYQYFKR